MLGNGYGGLYKAPTKEERKKFIDLRFERWQVVRSRKARRRQEEGKAFHKLHVLGMNDDLWDKVHGLGSETWKECE